MSSRDRHEPPNHVLGRPSVRDREEVRVTLTRRDVQVLRAMVQRSYGASEKKAEQYVKRHGRPFEPEPGKMDAGVIGRDRMAQIDHRLAAALGQQPVLRRLLPDPPCPAARGGE